MNRLILKSAVGSGLPGWGPQGRSATRALSSRCSQRGPEYPIPGWRHPQAWQPRPLTAEAVLPQQDLDLGRGRGCQSPAGKGRAPNAPSHTGPLPSVLLLPECRVRVCFGVLHQGHPLASTSPQPPATLPSRRLTTSRGRRRALGGEAQGGVLLCACPLEAAPGWDEPCLWVLSTACLWVPGLHRGVQPLGGRARGGKRIPAPER